ncbi:MAG: HAD hydrolase-like protein [Gemmobacter sp.]|nr:HAD hydrolase-like protein [Gemmobacter sp.]
MADFLRGGWTDRAAVLADLDGCLIAGNRVLPQVPALIETCGSRLWIVSNNSTDTAAGLSQRLAGMGLDHPADRIVLAGEETLRAVASERPGARVALFATPALQALAQHLGLVAVNDRADVAVLARDTGFCFADLARLADIVGRGTPLWLTNPDPSHPDTDGRPVPETGALFAALLAMLPDVAPRCIGKPAPDLIRKALARAAVLPGAAVYIGDTPQTDGGAARAAGVEFVQIAAPIDAPRQLGAQSC